MNMKTLSLIVLISIIFSTLSFAQNENDKSKIKDVEEENYVPESEFRAVRMGIYGGLGLSWFKPKTENYRSEGSRLSYNYGFLFDYNFTENYTFSSGINISGFGGALTYPDSINQVAIDRSRNYNIRYLEIPTIIKLKTNQLGYFTPFAQLGLRHDFRLSAEADDEYILNNNLVPDNGIDITKSISFYRMSFSFALGTEFTISQSLSAFAFLSFDNGLTNSLNGKSLLGIEDAAFIKKIDLTVGFLF
jgi:hypothetical protein